MKQRTRSLLALAIRVAALAGLVAWWSPRTAAACSMCRCGDPTFNALGTQVFPAMNAFRLAIDWERFDKENGIADGAPGDREGEVEQRETVTLSYTLAERLNLVARLPFSQRTLTTTTAGGQEVEHSSGLADPEFLALWQLWSAPFSGGMGSRTWVSVMAGVKTPWGQNDLSRDGERLEEHLQPGTGSTDWSAGLSGVHLLSHTSSLFASLSYRLTGSNSEGYRYGRAFLANLGIEGHLGARLDAVLDLNYRDSERDRVDSSGALDPNTGGRVLYVTPRLLLDLGRGAVLRAAASIPVATSLYGDQTEHTVYNLGVTFLL